MSQLSITSKPTMEPVLLLCLNLTNSPMNLEESLELELATAIPIQKFVKRKKLLLSQLSKFILPNLCLLSMWTVNQTFKTSWTLQPNIYQATSWSSLLKTSTLSWLKTHRFQRPFYLPRKKETQWFTKD